MPMEDIQLRKSHTIQLLVDLGFADIVAAGIYHDTTVRVERRIFDQNWLFDLEAAVAIRNHDLLQCRECVNGTPGGGGCNSDRIAVSRHREGV